MAFEIGETVRPGSIGVFAMGSNGGEKGDGWQGIGQQQGFPRHLFGRVSYRCLAVRPEHAAQAETSQVRRSAWERG